MAVRGIEGGECAASFYDSPQLTASGERFDPAAMTTAHRSLPLGSVLQVIEPRSGAWVVVRVNDRGPHVTGRCLDLSRAAFAALGDLNAGTMTIRYRVLAE